MPGRARGSLGEPDARHLWIGEHNGRHRAVVVVQAVAVKGVLRGELGAIGSHVDELVAAGDVAGGIDVSLGRAHAVVDHDAAFRRDGDPVLGQPKALDVGRAPRGDQHMIGVDRNILAVARDRQRHTAIGFADRAVSDAGDNGDAFVPEISRERRADLGLGLGEQTGPADEGHPDAGTSEHLGEFRADVAAADHEQRARQFLEVERRRASEIRHGLDARNGGHRRPRAGRDDDLASGDTRAVYFDTAVEEASWPVAIGDAVVRGEQIDVLGLAQFGNEGVLLTNGSPPVCQFGFSSNAGKTCRHASVVKCLGRADQGL